MMGLKRAEYAVFTKPWMTLPLPELGRMVKGTGFDAIELPVRPGFQVTPEQVAQDLPRAARELFA
jgi:sugar phosphate isomerase/epimerase